MPKHATSPTSTGCPPLTQQDQGFDTSVFAQMLGFLSRFGNRELPLALDEVPALRR
ncbi:hypothetical protein G3I59_46155 [Amycolatopsis rubida]|uniref:Uncharacterized protein n=1 Tax=Amycolatopsis rubida TaxID=112413 RepID=A0ABX0C542_9PSEU|nr:MULTISPECIES: hypothetical protein [Amycolatopsis]MYW97805.1 hypothetical protein [Amycolatopsis rubida]NEC62791.1 hypothetical protein [Amycolatopsis rubida]